MKKRIILNAFDMTCVSHQSAGTWRHPSSQASKYNDIDYWTNLARELERGCFDTMFIADVVGLYDVYRGTAEMALKDAAQVPVNDPFGAISAMAAVTSNVGFGVTAAVDAGRDRSSAAKVFIFSSRRDDCWCHGAVRRRRRQ